MLLQALKLFGIKRQQQHGVVDIVINKKLYEQATKPLNSLAYYFFEPIADLREKMKNELFEINVRVLQSKDRQNDWPTLQKFIHESRDKKLEYARREIPNIKSTAAQYALASMTSYYASLEAFYNKLSQPCIDLPMWLRSANINNNKNTNHSADADWIYDHLQIPVDVPFVRYYHHALEYLHHASQTSVYDDRVNTAYAKLIVYQKKSCLQIQISCCKAREKIMSGIVRPFVYFHKDGEQYEALLVCRINPVIKGYVQKKTDTVLMFPYDIERPSDIIKKYTYLHYPVEPMRHEIIAALHKLYNTPMEQQRALTIAKQYFINREEIEKPISQQQSIS